MKKFWSRKEFLRDGIKFAAGAAAGVTGAKLIQAASSVNIKPNSHWPWPYSPLDSNMVRGTAHDQFYGYGCCYAGFAGILIPLKEKIGEPFYSFPMEMMSYGGAGVKGWGTLCGALNGAAAAVSLVRDIKSSGVVINELLHWYTLTMFPSEAGNACGEQGYFGVDKKIPALSQSKSGSPLCHVSVTRWCKVSGYSIGSPEQQERCARLSGDVAAKTVELLNDQHSGLLEASGRRDESAGNCLECHGHTGEAADVDTKMNCIPCHGDPHK